LIKLRFQAAKRTIVNRAMPSLHGGPVDTMLTERKKEKMKEISIKNVCV